MNIFFVRCALSPLFSSLSTPRSAAIEASAKTHFSNRRKLSLVKRNLVAQQFLTKSQKTYVLHSWESSNVMRGKRMQHSDVLLVFQ